MTFASQFERSTTGQRSVPRRRMLARQGCRLATRVLALCAVHLLRLGERRLEPCDQRDGAARVTVHHA
eukprot:scaffold89684_cov30-Tisochrysis_lutea.AAC.2